MELRLVNSTIWRRIDELDDTFKIWSIVATKDNLKLFSDQVQIMKGNIYNNSLYLHRLSVPFH